MGGSIEWSALDLVVEMFGVEDPERFIHALVKIRDLQQGQPNDNHQPT